MLIVPVDQGSTDFSPDPPPNHMSYIILFQVYTHPKLPAVLYEPPTPDIPN